MKISRIRKFFLRFKIFSVWRVSRIQIVGYCTKTATIPKEIASQLNLAKGDYLAWKVEGKTIRVKKINEKDGKFLGSYFLNLRLKRMREFWKLKRAELNCL
mgnify:CR=1 FL=1